MFTYRVSFFTLASVVVECQSTDFEEIIEKAVVAFEIRNPRVLWDVEQIESLPDFNEDAPNAIYVDATMEGAKRPYYISTDVTIKQI